MIKLSNQASNQEPAVVMVITGGIAAYKALEVIRLLRKASVKVYPIMTHHAKSFVTPLSVSVLAENKVYVDFSDLEEGQGMGHIELTRAADLVVVCPASADIIASHAGGFAGSLATSLLLASNRLIYMFPAMNPTMWAHPAVVSNVKTLRERDVNVFDPEWGLAACREEGVGRLPEPHHIAAHILDGLGRNLPQVQATTQQLKNKHVLITAGPTRESLDSVRYLSNRSTGRQGYALAHEAHKQGAKVTLVSGPTTMASPPQGIHYIEVESAAEMLQACENALPADVVIGCAAVCDWRTPRVAEHKIAKSEMSWDMVTTPDVIARIACLTKGETESQLPLSLIIGFSAETGEKEAMVQRAYQKMAKKGCNWMVVNEANQAIGAIDNEITLLTPNTREDWQRMDKHALASRLMEKIAETICSPIVT